MVDAEYSGVLFTRDPSAAALRWSRWCRAPRKTWCPAWSRPNTYRFGRVTKKPFGSESAPIDLARFWRSATLPKRLFGGAQDMEWTYRGGRVLSGAEPRHHPAGGRRRGHGADAERSRPRHRHRCKGASPDQVVFGKNELSEMLPRPTPLSLSLMEALWAAGGSVDLAARELGLTYRGSGRRRAIS